MKIGIAIDNGMVSGHFGHCEGFLVFRPDGDRAVLETRVSNPGHEPGRIPLLMKEHGITHVVAGGMGPRAQQMLIENGIVPVLGITGSPDDVANSLLHGRIRGAASLCTHEQCDCSGGNH